MGPLGVVAIVAIGIFFVYWGVKQIWTWIEPMSTPAQFIMMPSSSPRPPSALDDLANAVGVFLGFIVLIPVMVFALYLFLVLLKFLWARA